MITVGYDIGTRFIKVCIVNQNVILGYGQSEMGKNIGKSIKRAFQKARDRAGIKKKHVVRSFGAGFGSDFVDTLDDTRTVESCLARATFQLDKKVRTIIDIGGLFITLVTINDRGGLTDQITNDRCAAGSGKFLEMVCEAVGIPFTRITKYVSQSQEPYLISGTCAVFAESEIISELNAGRNETDIIAGLLHSIVLRTVTLLERMTSEGPIFLSGGVSRLPAFRTLFEEKSKRVTSLLPIEPQLVVAYGAALLAQD